MVDRRGFLGALAGLPFIGKALMAEPERRTFAIPEIPNPKVDLRVGKGGDVLVYDNNGFYWVGDGAPKPVGIFRDASE